METPPLGDVAVSATFCDESVRAISSSWGGNLQVYKADDAAAVGTLSTNPPTLEERLTAAQKNLQEKTAASAPAIEAGRKADAELAALETTLTTAKNEGATLQTEVDGLVAQVQPLDQFAPRN